MNRTKIDYGIDLGTTNSGISRMDEGHPSIVKAKGNHDTIPSCVAFNRKQAISVGAAAIRAYDKEKLVNLKSPEDAKANAFIEFKRTMGTDKKYECANASRGFASEELSAEVLKALRSFVLDDQVDAAVVTIPAKFTANQKDATLRAASMAGLKHCELLQEPIAAATAYALASKDKDGYWLIFDFGGGTFDAAIVSVDEGVMKFVDTEGDNYLGGKNLDNAIVDEIIMPYVRENYDFDDFLENDDNAIKLKEALKIWAERAKIELSFSETADIQSDLGDLPEDDNGEELELDISVTRECLKKAIGPLFQKSIDLCLNLLERNGMPSSSLNSLILVGGPTLSPILREMLSDQLITPNTSMDPMTVVSTGAALFASTIDVSEKIIESQKDNEKIQLILNHEPTTVELEEFVTIALKDDSLTRNENLFAEILRGDEAWSSPKIPINLKGDVVGVALAPDRPNTFSVHLYNEKGDRVECQPSSFSILQGTKIGPAKLNYHFGVEVKDKLSGEVVFRGIKGLRKNDPVPATGTQNGLITQKEVRPGIEEDTIRIPIYQGDYDSEDTKAVHNEFVYEVMITGEDLPSLLPAGSEVDLVLKVDRDDTRMFFSAYFPLLDEEIKVTVPTNSTQREVDSEWMEAEFDKAKSSLSHIREESDGSNESEVSNLESELSGLEKDLDEGKGDYDRKKEVLNNLRKSLKKIDKLEESSDWPNTESELIDAFEGLEETNSKFGDGENVETIEQIRSQVEEVVKNRDVKTAKDLISIIRGLNYKLADEGLGAQMEMMWIYNYQKEFDLLDWSDPVRARETLNEGMRLAAVEEPDKESLRRIVMELHAMLPNVDEPMLESGKGDELIG